MKFKVGDIVECIDIDGDSHHRLGEIYRVIRLEGTNGNLCRVVCAQTGIPKGAGFHKRFRHAKETRVVNLLKAIDAQEKLIRPANKKPTGGRKRSPRKVQKRPVKTTRTVRNRHGAS